MEFNQEKAYLLGGVLKYLRKKHNYSIKTVAEITNYNHGYISQLENGVKQASEETVNIIISIYHLRINFDNKLLEECRNILISFYKDYVDEGWYDEKQIKHMKAHHELYENSIAMFSFYLILFFEAVTKNEFETADKLEEVLNEYSLSLNKDERAIFYSIAIMYRLFTNKNTEAEQLLLKAKESSKVSNVKEVSLLIQYHSVIIYRRLGNAAKALRLCSGVQHEFLTMSNYFRANILNIYVANCYGSLGLYKEARAVYSSLLEKRNIVKDPKLIQSIYCNMSWNYLMDNCYKESIIWAKRAIEEHLDFNELLINIPYAKYKLNQHKRALRLILDINQETVGEYLFLFVETIKDRIQKNDCGFLKKAQMFYEQASQRLDLDMEEIILKELLEFYQERDDYYKIIETQDKIIDLLKRRR